MRRADSPQAALQSTMLLVTWAMEAGLALLQAYVFGALLLIYAGETHPCYAFAATRFELR